MQRIQEVFSRREGYAASTLRWWASKLKRDLAAAVVTPPTATPEVRLARVLRVAPPVASSPPSPAITLEVGPGGVRIGVAAGAERATLAMVLDVLGVRP